MEAGVGAGVGSGTDVQAMEAPGRRPSSQHIRREHAKQCPRIESISGSSLPQCPQISASPTQRTQRSDVPKIARG